MSHESLQNEINQSKRNQCHISRSQIKLIKINPCHTNRCHIKINNAKNNHCHTSCCQIKWIDKICWIRSQDFISQGFYILPFKRLLRSIQSPTTAAKSNMAPPEVNPYTAVSCKDSGATSIRNRPIPNHHIRAPYKNWIKSWIFLWLIDD